MKKVFLFTHSFPFSETGEAFIENELKFAFLNGVELSIVPLYSLAPPKQIPDNINIISDLYNTPKYKKILIFVQMFFNPLFFRLFFYKKSIYYRWKNWYNALKYLYGGLLIKNFLISNSNYFQENSILYSFWFNYTVLGFALAKEQSDQFKKCIFYSRAHRYDLYGEDQGIFIPYREKMFSAIKLVFPGSIDGVRFLTKNYPQYSSKIELGRLGVPPLNIGIKSPKNTDISLVSCSYVSPIKRVLLIFNSIHQFCKSNPAICVSWIHIGDGVEMNILQEHVNINKLNNLNANLVGTKSVAEINELLGNNEFDAFINLSLSEGLPVTLMMAISVGIPVIATDAGGTNEIVTEETGYLLSLDVNHIEFSAAVLYCKDNRTLRESAMRFYNNNFSDEKNYNEFYKKL
jgi:glycosyltransferase involved in cell wall biosynthesis